MPRPGPRPFECVRRAWHSDRHQSMRGTVIQQILRVVHENHNSATKKNKEWQEKLLTVVFKAEEIMYSKANSEVEYMDLETLWDRVNDAINTIIRRDEGTETGELLPPCVEAALNLGCVPERASRSQRHSNPRSYLSPRTQKPGCAPSKISDNITNEQNPNLPPLHPGNRLALAMPTTVNSSHLVSESNRHVMQNNNNNPTASCNFHSSYEIFPPPHGNKQFIPVESNPSLNVGSIYPLYYGTNFQPEVSRMGFQTPKNSNIVIVGRPILPSIAEPAEMGCLQNRFSCDGDENASNRITQAYVRDNHGKEPEMECDLSLRLGLSLDQCTSREKDSSHDNDSVGPSSSQDGAKVHNPSSLQHKEFSFFPVETAKSPLEFCASQWNREGEGQNVAAAVRKRKVPFKNDVEDGQFSWQPNLSSNHFTGQMKRPGL